MTLSLYDRVIETTQTGGTGPVTLLGTIPGYQPFTVVGNGNSCYFYIYECGDTGAASGAWEVCFGTYNSATPSLSRTTVISSSNNGNPVNFPAGTTKRVVLSMPAVKAVYADSNNNVGIGTSSPNAKLEVLSTSGAPQLRLSYNDIDTFSDFTVSADGYLYITSPSGGGLILTGNLFFDGDGNWDIGSDSLNRPNDIYFTGSLLGGPLANIQIGDLGYMKFGRFVTHLTSNGIIGNLCMMNANHDNFGLLQFGGTTSSYPALKRNGTSISARLADDSDAASISGKELLVDTGVGDWPFMRTGGGDGIQFGTRAGGPTGSQWLTAQFAGSNGNETLFLGSYITFGGSGLTGNGGSGASTWWSKATNQIFLLVGGVSNTATAPVYQGIDARTSGTPAAGYGATYQYQLQSSTTVAQPAVDLTASWATATHASRKGRFTINVYDTASRECIRCEADGSNPMVGFYGVNAVARQLLATGAGHTVDDVISALQTLGLLRQS